MSDKEELEGIGPGGAYEPENHSGKGRGMALAIIVSIVALLVLIART